MEITNELGEKVIKVVTEYIDLNINIMDLSGKIVASTNKHRINQIHSGAIEVIKTSKPLILDGSNIKEYPNTQLGVNLPIMHQGKIRGIVGVSGDPKEIHQVTGLIRATVEIVIDQIHLQRQAHFEETQWNYWLRELLHPSGFNYAMLEEEAVYSLNIDTKKYWRILVIIGKNAQNFIEKIHQEVSGRKINPLFVLPFCDEEVIVALPAKFKRVKDFANSLMKTTHDEFRIGVGEALFGIYGIRESYEQAKQALEFAKKQPVVSFSEQWKIERLIHSISDTEYKNICTTYEKSLNALGEIYIETIDTFIKNNLSIKKTSDALHIHRNTLLYRLDQIKEKVGLDPRLFNDLFILKIIRSRNL